MTFAGSATSGGRTRSRRGPYTRQMAATRARYSAFDGAAVEAPLKERTSASEAAAAASADAPPRMRYR